MENEETLSRAKQKDIKAFNALFVQHEGQLKSYLYRLLTNRESVEDFYHNIFIKGFDKIETFNGDLAQFKSWIFTIATRMAYNHLKKRKKWGSNAQDNCRDSLINDPQEQKLFATKVMQSTHNIYEVKEHIDFCFTCINKTVPIEQQLAILLKVVCDFKVKEVAEIMNKSQGQVKHLLVDVRKTMANIFENRCALINRNGTCHQCSELQGLFNPKMNMHRELMKLQMTQDVENVSKIELFELREKIVSSINPMKNKSMDLHDFLMQHLKKVNKL